MLPEHTTNSVASASSKLRAGEHWARLHDIQHIQESVGLLGRIPLVVLEYRLAGGWLSITLPEGGSALIAHFGQLLARDPTTKELAAPEKYLLNTRCWLRVGWRYGQLRVFSARAP